MAEQTDIISSRMSDKFTADKDQDPVVSVLKPMDRYSRCHMMTSRPTVKSLLAQRGSPNSLNRLIGNRGSLKAVHASFVRNMESSLRQNKKQEVSFEEIDYGYGDAAPGSHDPDATDYGYGDATPDDPSDSKTQTFNYKAEEPDAKRRRYQRRNSKTPAMLLAMNSPLLLHLDFLEDQKGRQHTSLPDLSPSSGSSSLPKDTWDGGLEIAEELFKHLQKRRQSQT